MKAQKRLNVILVILIILLLSLVSFVGIFYKDKNQMVSKLPSYLLGTDLTGYRKVVIEPKPESDVETGTENVTAESNTIENKAEENSTSESTSNSNENKAGDYRKSVEVIKARLKSLEVENYTVSCDESTGKIEISLPENDQTDTILSDITQKGSFVISDSDTGETLITNNDVKNVRVGANASTSSTTVYMSINFNTKGAKKFKDITSSYQNVIVNSTDVETNETNTTSNETSNEIENTTSNETNSTNTTNTTTNVDKKITLKIDDTEMMSTDFSEIIDNGVLSLTIGSSTDSLEIKDKIYGGKNIAAIIENDAMPIQYQITGNTYVTSTIENNTLKVMIYIEIGLGLLVALFMVIKFRTNGVLVTILSIGYLSILLLVIRYANVILSVEGIFGIAIGYAINCVFQYMICKMWEKKDLSKKEKGKELNKIIKKYSLILIPELIIAVVACLTNWSSIFSLGMVMFWSIVISWIYNVVLSKLLINQIGK